MHGNNLIVTSVSSLIVFVVFMGAMSVEARDLVTDGLVGYWAFNAEDIEDDVVKDVWGEHDGVLIGEPEIVQGKFLEALQFDGVDDYVEVPDHEDLQLWERHTLEAWIYQLESRSSRIIDKIGAGTANGPHLDTHPGTTLRTCAGNCISTAATYNLEEWNHVAVTFDEGEIKLYINGVVEGEGSVASPLAGYDLSLKVAADSDGQNLFVGIIDEVRVYNRALGEEEINQNMISEGLSVEPSSDSLPLTWGKIKNLK